MPQHPEWFYEPATTADVEAVPVEGSKAEQERRPSRSWSVTRQQTSTPLPKERAPPDSDWKPATLHVLALAAAQILINSAIMAFIYQRHEETDVVYVQMALWLVYLYSVALPIMILRFVYKCREGKMLRTFLRVSLTLVDMATVPLLANLARQAAQLAPPTPLGCGLAIVGVALSFLSIMGVLTVASTVPEGSRDRYNYMFVLIMTSIFGLVAIIGSIFTFRERQTILDYFFPGNPLRDEIDAAVLVEALLDHAMIIGSLVYKWQKCQKG